MSAAAIVMMLVSIMVLWGGLTAATINLARQPLEPEDRHAQNQRLGRDL